MCSGGDEARERVRLKYERIDELEREISEVAGHIAAATCRWLLLIAEFDRMLGWASWGAKSCAQWLSWRCSIGSVAAREHVRVARRLGELPLVREAFASGELSYCKVRAITRVATPKVEASLVELARHATGSQLERLVRGYRGAMNATLEIAQAAHARRHFSWSREDDGSIRFHGLLPAEEGELLLAALDAIDAQQGCEREEGDVSAEALGLPMAAPVDVSRADALVAMARATLAADQAARPGGDPVEMVVHVDVGSLTGERFQTRGEVGEDGVPLAPETLRRLGCDAAVVSIVERDGRPLSVGRRTRTIPPALRRALRTRDHGCRFPGCTHKRFLHAHHITHWARGGATSLDNLVQLCSYHHRLVHEGGFSVSRVGPDRLRFRRPDGTVVPASAPCAKAVGPTIERRNRDRGLVVDDRTCRPRSVGQPIDYGLAVELLCARALKPG
jgi:Domain of unknown function (DUF222)/HNH endonuclease